MSNRPRNPFSSENRQMNESDAKQPAANGYSTSTDSPPTNNTEEAWKLVISDNVEETRDTLVDSASPDHRDTSTGHEQVSTQAVNTSANTLGSDIRLEGESANDARQFNHYQSEVILRPSTLALSHHDSLGARHHHHRHHDNLDMKEEFIEKTGDEEEFLENILRGRDLGHFRTNPVNFMIRLTSESTAFYLGSGWRSYSDYIGARILHGNYCKDIKKQVLQSKRIRDTIKYLSSKQAMQLQAQPSVAKTVEREIRLERELEVVIICIYLSNILVRLYHQGIHIKESELLELRRHAIKAQQNGHSLIILPCHKSHVDYLLISYVFFRLGLALPHIAAGDNLDLPVVGNILRHGGAFFIRRSWENDLMYTELAREYIETLLEKGYNIECFIEGTRSKLLQPKFGILKLILEGLQSGRTDDCIIVPMSIGYDRVIETETYAHELLGQPKKKESLQGIFNSTKLLQLKWGRVDVRFATPFSLKEYIEQQTIRRAPFDPSQPDDKDTLLRSLGYRQCIIRYIIMPTALVGTVILTLRGRGVGRSELIRRVNWLRRAIIRKGGRVAYFGNMSTGDIVDRAVQVMRELVSVQKDKDILEPVFYTNHRFELSFFRNQVIHLFLSEAIISASMYVQIKIGGIKSAQRIHHNALRDNAAFLSRLLKDEFIYQPGTVEENVEETLASMEQMNVIITEDEYIGLSDIERNFYCFLIWPFIETYWLADGCTNYYIITVSSTSMVTPAADAQGLMHSTVGAPTSNTVQLPAGVIEEDGAIWVEERIFLKKAQGFGRTLYYQGDISYMEAVNQETLKNAFHRLQDEKVMLIRRSKMAPKEPTRIALHPHYVPARHVDGSILPEGRLWSLVERISQFRREGKNRRDNATVSSRVLRLAELSGISSWTGRTEKITLLMFIYNNNNMMI
ncbi:acyltransferase-domain-containing protein [Syncephalis plumigaleata]|nr:acyltransferase-domain-containing protein [Syncephalis plumigaleata]